MYNEKEIREMLKTAPVLLGKECIYADTDSIKEQEQVQQKEIEKEKEE